MGAAYLNSEPVPRKIIKGPQCMGKVAFVNAALAYAVANKHGNYRNREVYRCASCGKWHSGPSRYRPPSINKRKAARLVRREGPTT
jgi:hypothetical protein